jgi:hypothetical protein
MNAAGCTVIPVVDRLSQRPQPDPGLLRDELDANPLARLLQTALNQKRGEPIQHNPIGPDGALSPPGITQHRQDTAGRVSDISLSHHNHLRPSSDEQRRFFADPSRAPAALPAPGLAPVSRLDPHGR